MLSYRHAFHAGNHADVLKHIVVVQLAAYLARKEKPFTYIDTHAGAGTYALDSALATKLAEHRTGIGRLWQRDDFPPLVSDYLRLVGRLNSDGRLRAYPGSPLLAAWTTRSHDALRLFELHSRDVLHLRENMLAFGQRVRVAGSDGLAAIKALLPPPSRRALVFIDPAYEDKADYERVIRTLHEALQRFPGGTYALWYPQLTRREAHALPQRLKRLPATDWLHVGLRVRTPSADGFGMHGSGLFVINPPWTLAAQLQEAMPHLVEALALDAGAGFTLECSTAAPLGA